MWVIWHVLFMSWYVMICMCAQMLHNYYLMLLQIAYNSNIMHRVSMHALNPDLQVRHGGVTASCHLFANANSWYSQEIGCNSRVWPDQNSYSSTSLCLVNSTGWLTWQGCMLMLTFQVNSVTSLWQNTNHSTLYLDVIWQSALWLASLFPCISPEW